MEERREREENYCILARADYRVSISFVKDVTLIQDCCQLQREREREEGIEREKDRDREKDRERETKGKRKRDRH